MALEPARELLNRMTRVSVIIFLLIGAAMLESCDKAREERKPADPLMEISPALFLHVTMMQVDLKTCEMLMQVFGEKREDAESVHLRNVAEETAATCAIIKQAARNNAIIAASVRATKSLPDKLFFFYKVEQGRGELLSKAIGLFTTLNECKVAEETYRQLDIPTRRCRQWDGQDFSILD